MTLIAVFMFKDQGLVLKQYLYLTMKQSWPIFLLSSWSVPVRFIQGFVFLFWLCNSWNTVLCGPFLSLPTGGGHTAGLCLWVRREPHSETRCFSSGSDITAAAKIPCVSHSVSMDLRCLLRPHLDMPITRFFPMFHSPECCAICALWQSLSLFFLDRCPRIYPHCDGYSNKEVCSVFLFGSSSWE